MVKSRSLSWRLGMLTLVVVLPLVPFRVDDGGMDRRMAIVRRRGKC